MAQECWRLTEGWPAALQLLLDRLARLDPPEHGTGAGTAGAAGGGRLWQAFAADLVAGEPLLCRQVLTVAALAPRVDTGLLNGVGISATADDSSGCGSAGCSSKLGRRATTGSRR